MPRKIGTRGKSRSPKTPKRRKRGRGKSAPAEKSPKSASRCPPAAARRGQARRTRLPRLSAAAGPGRDAADDGTGAGRPRRHLAAIRRADHAQAYPGLSGADLARVALLTPQTVGVIIRNLERDGAIRKTPHPVHGRVLQWTMTPRGGTLLDKCRRHALAIERRLAAGLSANGAAPRSVAGWPKSPRIYSRIPRVPAASWLLARPTTPLDCGA